nr:ATP-grasp domain-containing protein [Streptomyces sp. HUAS 15-9]
MTSRRVLVLGGNARTLGKAAAMGLEVVNFQKPALFTPEVVGHCAQVHLIDYQDIELVTRLARTLHAVRPFERILTQSEIGQLVVGHLNDELGLQGNGLTVMRTLHDKLALRTLLNAKGIGPVDVVRGTNRDALHRFVAEHGSAVVKPVMGSGSLGVRKIRSVAEVDEVWDWLSSFGIGTFMVEELLEGREVSVETFSYRGEHHVLAVTGKETGGGVVELGHVVPAPLGMADQRAVADFTAAVLDTVGVAEGTAHTELILTAAGPRVVESHARCGGDRITKLVELSTGIDMEELPFHLLDTTGFTVPSPEAKGAAAIRFLTAEPGRVVTVEGVEKARAHEAVIELDVKVQEGDLVRPLHWSEDRCGYVLVHAASTSEAIAQADKISSSIEIRTEAVADIPEVHMNDVLAEVDEILDPFA